MVKRMSLDSPFSEFHERVLFRREICVQLYDDFIIYFITNEVEHITTTFVLV